MHEDVADATALAVNRVLDEFLATLAEDVSKRAFKRLLFGKQTLGDVDLGYKPETYTRFNLVEPLLTAIDLEYQLEPRSTDINRDRWPDIKLTSSAIPYIGEVKALNDIDSGREEIKEYLGIDGFIAPYGMLTDGAEWLIFGPPDDGGRTSNPVVRKRCSLADALKTVHWWRDTGKRTYFHQRFGRLVSTRLRHSRGCSMPMNWMHGRWKRCHRRTERSS